MKRLCALVCVVLAAACNETATSLGVADGGDTDADVADSGTSRRLTQPSTGRVVFDPTRVAKIEIEVSETDRETLRADANKRINTDDFTYVTANVRFDGELFENVGMRVKGNSSLRSGGDNPDAIPYKLDVNKFVDGQKLDGLTKINLHRNASLNEYLSYGAFRKAGIAASRTGWADITLNGVSLGLYTLVEQVDDRMLESWYSNPTGELYKPEPPAGYLTYSGDDIAAYGDVGYKADKETDYSLFLEFLRIINEEPVESWDAVLDVQSVLDYFAGNVALGNWDTYVSMGHNYYLFESAPGRMAMLPWDLNLSQGSSGVVCPTELSGGGPGMGAGPRGLDADGGMPPDGFVLPDGSMPPERLAPGGGAAFPGGAGGFGARGDAPLYARLMQSEDGFERYKAALKEFIQGPGSEAALSADIDAVMPVLGERLDSAAVDSLRADIANRLAAIETALATTTECAIESAMQ